MAIFFNFQTTSSHLHPLQVENCDSNSRLVVDGDDNGKFRPERVKHHDLQMIRFKFNKDAQVIFTLLGLCGRGSETQPQVGANLNCWHSASRVYLHFYCNFSVLR